MRSLIPDVVDDPDLHEFYAADWIDRGGFRVNMISSADGAATAGGLSEGLQTPGDNRVFAVLRDLADAVLVGASTAVAENYRPIKATDERTTIRRRFGLDPETPLALTTRSLRISPELELFHQPGPRTLVYTSGAADAKTRDALAEVAEVVVCGENDVDLSAVKANLAARGLKRTLCEGGPTLFASMAAVGVVNELCLSISPLLVGPGPVRIVNGAGWQAAQGGLRLTGLLEEDGALFARYRTKG